MYSNPICAPLAPSSRCRRRCTVQAAVCLVCMRQPNLYHQTLLLNRGPQAGTSKLSVDRRLQRGVLVPSRSATHYLGNKCRRSCHTVRSEWIVARKQSRAIEVELSTAQACEARSGPVGRARGSCLLTNKQLSTDWIGLLHSSFYKIPGLEQH